MFPKEPLPSRALAKLGHLVEVRLPDEIRTVRLKRIESRTAAKKEDAEARAAANLEGARVAWNATLRGEKPADDFLRRLYRERRLTATELAARLRALDALASGKLRPFLP